MNRRLRQLDTLIAGVVGVSIWLIQAKTALLADLAPRLMRAATNRPPGVAGFSIALATVAAERGWRLSTLDMALFLYPGFCRYLTLKTGILLTPLILVLALLRMGVGAVKFNVLK